MPEISAASPGTSGSLNNVFVSPITHPIASSSRMRVIIASPSPILRALGCWSDGSLPTRIAMNTMLSIPSTISSSDSVSSEIRLSADSSDPASAEPAS